MKPLDTGGVMRCCIDTWSNYSGPEGDGTVMQCPGCRHSLIVRAGAWRWNREGENEDGQIRPD